MDFIIEVVVTDRFHCMSVDLFHTSRFDKGVYHTDITINVMPKYHEMYTHNQSFEISWMQYAPWNMLWLIYKFSHIYKSNA